MNVDLRGQGRSTRTPGRHTLDNMGAQPAEGRGVRLVAGGSQDARHLRVAPTPVTATMDQHELSHLSASFKPRLAFADERLRDLPTVFGGPY